MKNGMEWDRKVEFKKALEFIKKTERKSPINNR